MYIQDSKEAISRQFNGLPVIDATNDLRLYVSKEDIKNAKRAEFGMCVLANSCKRQFDVNKVAIMKTIGYVPLPDENGVVHAERFVLSRQANDLIKRFDRNEEIKPGACFLLLAPKSKETLDYSRKAQKKHRVRKKVKKAMTEKKKQVSRNQEGSIAKIFLRKEIMEATPREIHEKLDADWPLTSTRRAIKNLTDAKILRKMDKKKRADINSRPENVWSLHNLSKTEIKHLLSVDDGNIESSKTRMIDVTIRNGTGKIQQMGKS